MIIHKLNEAKCWVEYCDGDGHSIKSKFQSWESLSPFAAAISECLKLSNVVKRNRNLFLTVLESGQLKAEGLTSGDGLLPTSPEPKDQRQRAPELM